MSLALILKQCEIVSQLTPPGTPQRDGVYERHNCTLLDMVRSMMSLTDFPLLFWDYELEIAAFTLNRADTSILHHVFLLLFIMFLCIIMLFGVILMPFLS